MTEKAMGWRSSQWCFNRGMWLDDRADGIVYDGLMPSSKFAALHVIITPIEIKIQTVQKRYEGSIPLDVWRELTKWIEEFHEMRASKRKLGDLPPLPDPFTRFTPLDEGSPDSWEGPLAP